MAQTYIRALPRWPVSGCGATASLGGGGGAPAVHGHIYRTNVAQIGPQGTLKIFPNLHESLGSVFILVESLSHGIYPIRFCACKWTIDIYTICMCVCVQRCTSSLCLSTYLSVCHSVCPSVYVYLFVVLFVCLCVCLSSCLSVSLTLLF